MVKKKKRQSKDTASNVRGHVYCCVTEAALVSKKCAYKNRRWCKGNKGRAGDRSWVTLCSARGWTLLGLRCHYLGLRCLNGTWGQGEVWVAVVWGDYGCKGVTKFQENCLPVVTSCAFSNLVILRRRKYTKSRDRGIEYTTRNTWRVLNNWLLELWKGVFELYVWECGAFMWQNCF